jgi:NADP-dependent 3-hydroxy acid dehydrogenase YdfG
MNDILAVNVNGTLKVTHMILPGMIQKYEQVQKHDDTSSECSSAISSGNVV